MSLPVPNSSFAPLVLSETLPKHEKWLRLFNGEGAGPIGFGDGYSWSRVATPLNESRVSRWFGRGSARSERVEETVSVEPTRRRPSARKVAMASSHAVFSQLPTVKASDEVTQRMLDKLQEGDFWTLVQNAEVESSALGGVFLATRWDESLSDHVAVTTIPAYVAEPVFKNGFLESVQFVWQLRPRRDGESVVWRLVESHEVLEDGRGVVLWGLYQGSYNNWGDLVPLVEHPESAGFADLIDAELGNGYFTGLVDRLDVVYVRNAKAGFEWKGSMARNLGISDFAGAEETMAELDWWVSERASEARRARTRLHVPEVYAEASRPGEGLAQDIDRTVYTVMAYNPTLSGENGAPPLVTATSTALHNEQFQIAIDEAWRAISAVTGFSLSSLGAVAETTSLSTATGVRALREETSKTADMKQTVWRSALRELLQIMLLQQEVVFGDVGLSPELVEVEFASQDNADMTELVNNVAVLLGANAISLQTAVRMLHPDWDEGAVNAEVEAIESKSVESKSVGNPLMANPSGKKPAPSVSDIRADDSSTSLEKSE